MAYRAGLATLITKLRGMANAGIEDYVVAGDTYWSDLQLQARLDEVGRQWRSVRMDSMPTLVSSTYEYYDYCIPAEMLGDLEENATDSGWAVKDSAGGTVNASNYSVNYQARRISFSTNQQGSVYYLDARTYNTNQAAANVWRMKASIVAANVDWASDNMRVSASQESENCLRMAEWYDQMAGSKVGRFIRNDEVGT